MKACLFVLAAFVATVYAEAPYPAAGYRPAKAFLLPLQFRQRYEAYGPPNPSYGPPPPSYGPPPQTTEAPAEPEEEPTEATTEAATEAPEEVAPEEEVTEAPAEEEEQSTEPTAEEGRASEDNEVAQPTGLYYVLLPDGRLQRVLYSPGAPELGYTAQLRIANVDPIPPAPVYAYAGPLTRILRSTN